MTMIRMTIEVESIEDAIQLLTSERLAEEARTNANGFYYLLRNRIKHQDLPENETHLLEDVHADFCRLFEKFLT